MKAASRQARTSVLQVLAEVLRRDGFVATALDRELTAKHPPEQRRFVTDVAYGTLRYLPWIDATLAPWLQNPNRLPSEVRDVLRAAVFEIAVRGTPHAVAVDAWVDVVAHRPGPGKALKGLVNAVLRKVDKLDDDVNEAAAQALSTELWQHLRQALGEQAKAAARAMLEPPPLWLTLLHPDARTTLEAEGAEVRAGPISDSVSVRLPVPLAAMRAFQAGMVQPQNPSSAAVVAALRAGPGDRVLDVGSGHGIKAAQLLRAGSEVLMVEVDAERAREGARNLQRLGLAAQHQVADATLSLRDLPSFPYALLDAPCTGTGTLRRHPEIKLRWRAGDAQRAASKQAQMLVNVADRVDAGGVLVYAVCALGLEEGPRVVADFLESHDAWRAEPLNLELPTHTADVGAWILPTAEGLDGFYVARLRRMA